MNLGETFMYFGLLNGCSYVRASLCRQHVPHAPGGRVGFEVEASHIFPQGVLAAITLVRGGAGDGGARPCAGCEV